MASVIRSSSAARNCSPVVFSFEDAADQADRYLEEAQAQAAAIIAEAQRQADEISRRAEQAGHEAALLAATQQHDQKIAQQMQSLLPALQKTIDNLADVRQAWLRQWEHAAVNLAAKIAHRIIRRELSHHPDITVDQVHAALELAAGSPRLRISLNPDDFASLGNQIDHMSKEISRAAQVEIIPDSTISLGGCRVETHQGLIDQQIETQLERIVTELTDGNE